jgi:hypothetical protein
VLALQVLARKWCNITVGNCSANALLPQSHLFPESTISASSGTMCQYLQEPSSTVLLETINITAVKHAAENELQSARCTSAMWCAGYADLESAPYHIRVSSFVNT